MNTAAVRVAIVDDHRILRQGLKLSLESVPDIEVVGDAGDAESARELVLRERPEVVILDLQLGSTDGVVWARQILADLPDLKIVILTAVVDGERVRAAMEAGASAYVVKANAVDELLLAIRFARENHLYLCPQVMSSFMRPAPQPPVAAEPLGGQKDGLNPRDREIIRLVALGLRNKEIAEQLSLSVKSVETYRGRLMKQLSCESPADLVRWAIRQGLVTA